MRNKLSYDLFCSFDKKNWAPKCSYLEVFRNLRYWGLYVLTERVDCRRLGIKRTDSNACIFKEPSVFIDPAIVASSNPYVNGDIHHQKHPQLFEFNRIAFMEGLRSFIKTAPDSLFYSKSKGIQTYFDLDNIADWHLLLLVTHNADGATKNFCLYKRDVHALFEVIPWDYDHSFGRDGDNERHSPGIISLQENTLLSRLLRSPDYRRRLKQRFTALVSSGVLTSENIVSKVESEWRFLKVYAERNEMRWPVNADIFYDSNNFEQEVQLMEDWIPLQMKVVGEYLESL